jgi:uncharacterized membrane protein
MPTHPPLVHFPIATYVLGAVFNVLAALGHGATWGHDAFVAATWVMTAGLVISLLTAATGLVDWLTAQPGTQVRRTANAHALCMVTATVLALVTVVLAIGGYAAGGPSPLVVVLSVATALTVVVGATIGGALVYDYGFRVVNSTSGPEWERSDTDRLPDGSRVSGGGNRTTAG